MTKNLNCAILGTGGIAINALLPALSQVRGACLWSVFSRDLSRAQAVAKTHNAAAPKPAHDDIGNLLADPQLDAVIIATPDKLHALQAIQAEQAGKHVFVEKPMATSLEDAKAMVTACAGAGVKLGVAYHLHWHAGHRIIRDQVNQGELGELRHIRAQWTFPAADASNWRASSTVGRWWSLAGVGTHSLDFIRWIMVPHCGEVVALSSIISHDVWGGPHDETAVVAMRFESGATAEFCSSVLINAPSRAEIYGSEGYIRCEDTLTRFGAGEIDSHRGKIEFPVVDPYIGELQDFANAIDEGRDPEVAGNEGLRNVELLLQADA